MNQTLAPSKRGRVSPFIVMDVMSAAAQREAAGGDVLHLEVGQPSTPAPAKVRAAAAAALADNVLGYTLALGIAPLRARISQHYQDAYGVTVPAERVVITTGSSGAFLLSFLAAFDAGDRVALAAPGYPAYRNILSALNIEVVELPTGPESRYQPSADLLAGLDRPVQGLIVASPSNPTGTMLGVDEMSALTAYCQRQGIRLISDEIYHGISYGAPDVTAAAHDETAVVINSFSKYYSMTGWRLGWMVVPEDLLRSVECLGQNFFVSPPSLSQHAAVAAFDCTDELTANVAAYAENRAHLLAALPKIGFDRLAPSDGAFYLYADVGHLTNDSVAFCQRMLADTGVAATPGVDFDPERGHRTMRFSFAGSLATMQEATERLGRWLA